MCDYSLESVESRAAVDSEELVVKVFRSGTKGFVDSVDSDCAVCCKPGVEMTLFLDGIYSVRTLAKQYADRQEVELHGEIPVIFYSLAKLASTSWGGQHHVHRDGFLLPDGRFLSIQDLEAGTRATVTKALPKELKDAATKFDADIKLEMVPDYTPAPVEEPTAPSPVEA